MRRNSQALDTGSGHAVTIGDILRLERFQAHPNGTIWLIISWSAFRNRVNDQSEPKVRVANLTKPFSGVSGAGDNLPMHDFRVVGSALKMRSGKS